MTNRERVESLIADWRQREAGARFSASRNPNPTDRTQTDEADFYAARALALERLLAVADAAVAWANVPDSASIPPANGALFGAVRAWEAT